jgi:hypothetical protein
MALAAADSVPLRDVVLRLSLPSRRPCVTFSDMLWLAAAALTAAPPQTPTSSPVRAVVQAQATVRIISGTRIRLDGQPSPDAPPPSDGVVHTEGAAQPARLIEFQ